MPARAAGLCTYHYIKKWRKDHNYKTIGLMHKKRFGGNRNKVLKRDGYKCVKCGMDNQEHLKTWGCEITVDHINNKGRYSQEKDHHPDNLQTLCLRCHGKKDANKKRPFRELPKSSQEKILKNLKWNRYEHQ